MLASQDCCYFGDIHDEIPIAKATVSKQLKELKEAGLIQGEIKSPEVKFCINAENWLLVQNLFAELFKDCTRKKEKCCK